MIVHHLKKKKTRNKPSRSSQAKMASSPALSQNMLSIMFYGLGMHLKLFSSLEMLEHFAHHSLLHIKFYM